MSFPSCVRAAAVLAVLALVPHGSLPAQQAGPRFDHIALSSGVRLHYAEQGPASGEPIILLHGYSDSWFSFSLVLPQLARQYRVYALDQRGHGELDRPASGYHMRDLATDVLAFMDAKRIVRATIVGHSMGSFVAQQVVLAAPKRVTRLVLIGSSTAPRTVAGFDDLEAAVAALTDPVPREFIRDFQVSTIHQGVSAAFVDRVIAESAKLPARVWQALAAGMAATEPPVALGRLGVPTFIAWGDKDAYMTRAEQDALLAMIPSARLKTYANTGHAPHWERPREFAQDLAAFIAGRTVATESADRSR